ncbi:uncharacterized protein LOC141633025 [Silene latifolia]|uniref:uncharacterized protein LOC141633025 n=1 Tax=Silene latifolia TaxID=37657 RepID=UPI003D787FF8
MNNPSKKKEIKRLLGQNNVGLCGLVETKIKVNNGNNVRLNICDGWPVCTNSSLHKGGRIWLMWDPSSYDVTIFDIQVQSIHTKVVDKVRRKEFWFTMVYGMDKLSDREPLWDSLRKYHSGLNGPWLVGGDFNAILASNERIGGAPITNAEMRPLAQLAHDCQLTDLSAKGSFYTWNNKHECGTKVYSRLDRTLINADWLCCFPDNFTHFLPEGMFDHCPGIFGDIENLTHVAEISLGKFQEMLILDPMNPEICQAEKDCAKELGELRQARDQFLRQKEKMEWLKLGDDNTAFFHASIKSRRAKNRVFQVKDMTGQLCTTSETVQQAFENYYISLLGTSKTVSPINRRIVQYGKCLSVDHCEALLAPVTGEEIRAAMFSIPGNKAPGPDGYSSQFFKDNWELVGGDIIEAIKNFFCYGKLLKQCNATTITLVPKVTAPETVQQFRPISCCNTVYKCISKVLCNRISHVMPDIISPSQGAFIKGRDIVGNILICQDLIKLYKRKSCSRRAMMKIDLQKAYDSVEWEFVGQMLEALGFPEKICSLVMQCITTPSYSISLNGESFGFFRGRRGLRHGDPLSPLLFTVCHEYLSRVLMVVQKHTRFNYHPLCQRIKLSHLCFADDLIFFCKADRDSVNLMMKAFALFSRATGLVMNTGKSSLYCNGIDKQVLRDLEHISGMKRGHVPFTYLGVTVSPKRLSVMDYNSLVDNVVDRIRGLGSRKLSYAGRTVLLQSVLSTLHSYWARIFILPKTVISKIEAICRSYLWHAVGKYVWWVAKKADHLWVRWVHAIYIKNCNWMDYEPGSGSSWAWRKICQVKQIMNPYLLSLSGLEHYTIKAGYQWLKPDENLVSWYPWMLNKWLIPKQSFIVWLIAHQKLLTQDRLVKMQIISENKCFLCGLQEENLNHLFLDYLFSRKCSGMVSEWCCLMFPLQHLISWWIDLRQASACKKKVTAMILASLMYHIWHSRNCSRIDGYVFRPRVKNDVQNRLTQCNIRSKNASVLEWVEYIRCN